LTPEIQLTAFDYVRGGYTSNGSDHPTIFSDVVIPGSGENVGTKGAITWPLDKKWWTSNKSDFLDAHGLTSSTFTSPTIAGWSSDISTPPDGSPIYSMLAGKVTASDSCRVIVESDVSGGKLTIAYGHGNPSVKQGDTVSSGQKISSLAANCNATGGHLHVDMSLGGKHICPQDVFIAIGQDTNPDFAGLAKKYTGAPNGCGRV
jgi:murein DD-endopeptidase MepM/ murein hydrolase activator NlpD